MSDISRRQLVGTMAAGAALAAVGGAHAQEAKKAMKQYKNSDFYTNGVFNAQAAKEAYYELMRYHNYPIVDRLKTEEFWALDFGMGNFLEAGMAGIFWVNNKEHNYFGHEIYLLPGQAIPEHQHLATDVGPKLEGWQPRYGMIYLFGEGTPSTTVNEPTPPMHKECTKTKCVGMLKPGEVAGLIKAGEWHFMKAGPEGAIVTEYATYHDMAGLKFSHPKAKV